MGTSTTAVPFIDQEVKIDAHSATHPDDLGVQSVGEFAGAQSIRTEEVCETKELIITRADGAFIQGPSL